MYQELGLFGQYRVRRPGLPPKALPVGNPCTEAGRKAECGKSACPIDEAGTGNVTKVELRTNRAIETVRPETLHLPCARQFSTLPEEGHQKSAVATPLRR